MVNIMNGGTTYEIETVAVSINQSRKTRSLRRNRSTITTALVPPYVNKRK